jgi:hypothetical protein
MTIIEHSYTNDSIGSVIVADAICDICYQHNYNGIEQIIFTYSNSNFRNRISPDNGYLVAVFKCKKKIIAA